MMRPPGATPPRVSIRRLSVFGLIGVRCDLKYGLERLGQGGESVPVQLFESLRYGAIEAGPDSGLLVAELHRLVARDHE